VCMCGCLQLLEGLLTELYDVVSGAVESFGNQWITVSASLMHFITPVQLCHCSFATSMPHFIGANIVALQNATCVCKCPWYVLGSVFL
jgi:hypothetical protein